MNETDIRKYAKLMQELELTGLEITEGSQVVRLERGASVAAPAPVGVPAAVAAPAPPVAPAPARSADGLVTVASPLVGVFYAAPAENAAPYVAAGDRVKKGQTLCVIEAMKLMNEITAEDDGVVAEVCVTNGQVVEFGTELFRIKR